MSTMMFAPLKFSLHTGAILHVLSSCLFYRKERQLLVFIYRKESLAVVVKTVRPVLQLP